MTYLRDIKTPTHYDRISETCADYILTLGRGADWVWSSLHFEDGTNIFTITLGRGAASTGAGGFIQKDGKLTEITNVVNDFEVQDNGLPGNLKLLIAPGNLTIACQTIGAAGLRFIDHDKREAHLPRVMCTAQKSGGSRGSWLAGF